MFLQWKRNVKQVLSQSSHWNGETSNSSLPMTISLFQSFFTDEDTNLMKKFKLYVEDNWNKCDMVTIFLFIIGVTCRYVYTCFAWSALGLQAHAMTVLSLGIHVHKKAGYDIYEFWATFLQPEPLHFYWTADVVPQTTESLLEYPNTCAKKLCFSFFCKPL